MPKDPKPTSPNQTPKPAPNSERAAKGAKNSRNPAALDEVPANTKAANLANLAAQLLAPRLAARAETSGALRATVHDDEICDAIKVASRLLDLAVSCPRHRIHAYELFKEGVMMSMNDIAKTFKEHDWKNLTSENTVKKHVANLVGLAYKEIREDRAAYQIHLRQKIGGLVDLSMVEEDAKQTIGELLNRTNLSQLFGRQTSLVIDRQVTDLMVKAIRAIDCTLAPPEGQAIEVSFIARACEGLSYDSFIAESTAPTAFTSDDLRDIIAALMKFFGRTAPSDTSSEVLSSLSRKLANQERDFASSSKSFRECAEALQLPQPDSESVNSLFKKALDCLMHEWTLMLLEEFAANLPKLEPLEASVNSLRDHAGIDAAQITDADEWYRHRDFPLVMKSLKSWLNGVPAPSNTPVPFISQLYRSTPLFTSHLQNLHLFLRAIDDLERPDFLLGNAQLQSLVETIRTAIFSERKRLDKIPTEAISKWETHGESLLASNQSASKIGRVCPHLIFSYAAQRGLLEAELIKK